MSGWNRQRAHICPHRAEARVRGFKAASGSSTAYVAANIDARALGRYLRRSTALELPAKARQAVLRRLEHAAGPTDRGALGTPARDSACDHRGLGGLRAVTLNLRRGLVGKVPALGYCLRGWGYPDLVGLQEVGKLPALMVVHAMYWATFTPAVHPAAGVGLLVRWHPTFREIWRDMHSGGRGVALEYHSRGGHVLAVVVYFPADQDLDMVRSILAWVLGVMAPRRGVYTLMMGDLNANPGWATGFRQAPAALTILWEEFMQDTGLTRCRPATEVPTWTDGRGCVGVIDHILHGPAPKEGHLWVDEASPFPSDHRPVVWDARDAQDPEDRPPVRLRARHFQIRDPGMTGVYHAALSAARREEGSRPEGLAALYEYFLASTIQAVERAHGPPREFGELPGRVDQVHRQLQAHAKRCPRWWESLDTLKERLDLRQDLAEAWEVGNLQRYLSHLPEVAPFARPPRGAFRHLYGPVRTPPVQPRFCAHVEVAPRTRAKVALDQVRHRHQKTPRELTPGDIRALTGWVTPAQPLELPTATVPRLRRILQRTGNTAPARDQLQYWMLREMDNDGLTIVCEVVNRYMRGERLEALSHGDLHLLPKKPPHGIGANDRPLTNLVLLRKVVGLVVKEEEQPWLQEHGFPPPPANSPCGRERPYGTSSGCCTTIFGTAGAPGARPGPCSTTSVTLSVPRTTCLGILYTRWWVTARSCVACTALWWRTCASTWAAQMMSTTPKGGSTRGPGRVARFPRWTTRLWGKLGRRWCPETTPGCSPQQAFCTVWPGPTIRSGSGAPRRTRPPSPEPSPPQRTPWLWGPTCQKCTYYGLGWRDSACGTGFPRF